MDIFGLEAGTVDSSVVAMYANIVPKIKDGKVIKLSSNVGDVLKDTQGRGLDYMTYLHNAFPEVEWLLNTELANRAKSLITVSGYGLDNTYQDENGQWVIKVPTDLTWSLPEGGTSTDCCFLPLDFAKCGNKAPINLLCLKDTQKILDYFMSREIYLGKDRLDGINGNTLQEAKESVAKLSFAFYTAMNLMQSAPDVAVSNILKPFNGLASIMANAGVNNYDGTDPLGAFEEVAMHITIAGLDTSKMIFMCNPTTYLSLVSYVKNGMTGTILPDGWSVGANGEGLSFMGIKFLQTKNVYYDTDTFNGIVYMLSGDAIGAWLLTTLLPTDEKFIFKRDLQEQPMADGCAIVGTNYYNAGGCMVNNLNKLAKVTNIPATSAIKNVAGRFNNLINPVTIAPKL